MSISDKVQEIVTMNDARSAIEIIFAEYNGEQVEGIYIPKLLNAVIRDGTGDPYYAYIVLQRSEVMELASDEQRIALVYMVIQSREPKFATAVLTFFHIMPLKPEREALVQILVDTHSTWKSVEVLRDCRNLSDELRDRLVSFITDHADPRDANEILRRGALTKITQDQENALVDNVNYSKNRRSLEDLLESHISDSNKEKVRSALVNAVEFETYEEWDQLFLATVEQKKNKKLQ